MGLLEIDDELPTKPLKELVKLYLDKAYLSKHEKAKLIENGVRLSRYGKKKHVFDFLIINEDLGEIIGIDVKEWRRSIGVNVIRKFGAKVQDSGVSYGILVGTEFSEIARKRVPKNVILLSKGELISILRTL